MTPRRLIPAAALLLIAACGTTTGGSPTSAGAAAKPSRSAPPADGGTRGDPGQVIQDMNAARVPCYSPRSPQVTHENPKWLTLTCTNDAGQSITVNTYGDDTAFRDSEVNGYATSSFPIRGESMIAGLNWSVVGPDAFAAKVRAALGGKLVPSPAG